MEGNKIGNSIFKFEQDAGIDSKMGNWRLRAKELREAEENRIKDAKNLEESDLNKTEIGFVKFLFKIRNANNSKILKENIIPNEILFTRNPDDYVSRERVFIAGKIFPIMNSVITDDANAKKISLKKIVSFKTEFPVISGYEKLYSKKYISIDNDKIKILLPLNYADIDFGALLLDFLTNGVKTADTIGGEFPDYETYKLALREKAQPLKSWKGEDGCWLTNDRANNQNIERWSNGYSYIIKNKKQGWLAPFKQIYDFYNAVDGWIFRLGHRVKWCRGAKTLVKVLAESSIYFGGLENGSNVISNDVEVILNELNLGICDFAIIKFHELIYGKYAVSPRVKIDAYKWDVEFIVYEQGTIAPPIYKKTLPETISKFQDMADRDSKSFSGFEAWIGSPFSVVPQFDSFDPPAKITDNQFRIDLPLLMLYLDTHKPTAKSFIKHCNTDGTLNDEYKLKIIDYVP